MDGISRSRGLEREIPHCVLPMEQLVMSDKWARKIFLSYPHTDTILFFLLTTVFILKNKRQEVLEYAKIQFHMMTSFNITMASLDDNVREFQYNQCM